MKISLTPVALSRFSIHIGFHDTKMSSVLVQPTDEPIIQVTAGVLELALGENKHQKGDGMRHVIIETDLK